MRQTISNSDDTDSRTEVFIEDLYKPSCDFKPYWHPFYSFCNHPHKIVHQEGKIAVVEKTVNIIEGNKYYFTYLDGQRFNSCIAYVQDIVCEPSDPISGYLNLLTYDENDTDMVCTPSVRLTVPVSNIKDVNEVVEETTDSSSNQIDKEVRILILGISASVVETLIVNLEFINDNAADAVKYVSLSCGKTFNIAYEENKTIQYLTGTLVKLEKATATPNSNSIVKYAYGGYGSSTGVQNNCFSNYNCGYATYNKPIAPGVMGRYELENFPQYEIPNYEGEQVGIGNIPYATKLGEFSSRINDDNADILLVFNVGTDCHPEFKNIYLSQVRDVNAVPDVNIPDCSPVKPDPSFGHHHHDHDHHHHHECDHHHDCNVDDVLSGNTDAFDGMVNITIGEDNKRFFVDGFSIKTIYVVNGICDHIEDINDKDYTIIAVNPKDGACTEYEAPDYGTYTVIIEYTFGLHDYRSVTLVPSEVSDNMDHMHHHHHDHDHHHHDHKDDNKPSISPSFMLSCSNGIITIRSNEAMKKIMIAKAASTSWEEFCENEIIVVDRDTMMAQYKTPETGIYSVAAEFDNNYIAMSSITSTVVEEEETPSEPELPDVSDKTYELPTAYFVKIGEDGSENSVDYHSIDVNINEVSSRLEINVYSDKAVGEYLVRHTIDVYNDDNEIIMSTPVAGHDVIFLSADKINMDISYGEFSITDENGEFRFTISKGEDHVCPEPEIPESEIHVVFYENDKTLGDLKAIEEDVTYDLTFDRETKHITINITEDLPVGDYAVIVSETYNYGTHWFTGIVDLTFADDKLNKMVNMTGLNMGTINFDIVPKSVEMTYDVKVTDIDNNVLDWDCGIEDVNDDGTLDCRVVMPNEVEDGFYTVEVAKIYNYEDGQKVDENFANVQVIIEKPYDTIAPDYIITPVTGVNNLLSNEQTTNVNGIYEFKFKNAEVKYNCEIEAIVENGEVEEDFSWECLMNDAGGYKLSIKCASETVLGTYEAHLFAYTDGDPNAEFVPISGAEVEVYCPRGRVVTHNVATDDDGIVAFTYDKSDIIYTPEDNINKVISEAEDGAKIIIDGDFGDISITAKNVTISAYEFAEVKPTVGEVRIFGNGNINLNGITAKKIETVSVESSNININDCDVLEGIVILGKCNLDNKTMAFDSEAVIKFTANNSSIIAEDDIAICATQMKEFHAAIIDCTLTAAHGMVIGVMDSANVSTLRTLINANDGIVVDDDIVANVSLIETTINSAAVSTMSLREPIAETDETTIGVSVNDLKSGSTVAMDEVVIAGYDIGIKAYGNNNGTVLNIMNSEISGSCALCIHSNDCNVEIDNSMVSANATVDYPNGAIYTASKIDIKNTSITFAADEDVNSNPVTLVDTPAISMSKCIIINNDDPDVSTFGFMSSNGSSMSNEDLTKYIYNNENVNIEITNGVVMPAPVFFHDNVLYLEGYAAEITDDGNGGIEIYLPYIKSTIKYDKDDAIIYGGFNGSSDKVVDTYIALKGSANVHTIYGGSANGNVGSTAIDLSDNARVNKHIFGGSVNGNAESTTIRLFGNAFCGGYIVGGCFNGGNVDITNIQLHDNAYAGNVIGGGNSTTHGVSVDVDTVNIIVDGNATVNMHCAGGGYKHSVVKTANIHIKDNPTLKYVDGGGIGSNGSECKSCDELKLDNRFCLVENTNILIDGGDIEFVCAGGAFGLSTTDNTTVTVNGGTIEELMCGGVNGTTKKSNVTVNGGNVSNIYGSNRGYVEDLTLNINADVSGNVTSGKRIKADGFSQLKNTAKYIIADGVNIANPLISSGMAPKMELIGVNTTWIAAEFDEGSGGVKNLKNFEIENMKLEGSILVKSGICLLVTGNLMVLDGDITGEDNTSTIIVADGARVVTDSTILNAPGTYTYNTEYSIWEITA